jgi:hypothetical protein
MKKVLTTLLALCFLVGSFASTPEKASTEPVRASMIMIPVGKGGEKISLLELSTISKGDLEKLTGRKMNGAESFAFKGAQRQMKKGINEDGIVTGKKMKKMFTADGTTGFHLGGFALGFLVGLIGVLIAYLIKDDNKRNRVKWAWIGFGVFLVIYAVVLASVL